MLYIILGIVLVVALSSFMKKKESVGTEEEQIEQIIEQSPQSDDIEEQVIAPPLNSETQPVGAYYEHSQAVAPVIVSEPPTPPLIVTELVAPPITSPAVSASTMYSSAGDIVHAQKSIKKDAYGLHWCNKNAELNLTDFVLKGPMVYWSDGSPGVPEPSCIDISLPFEFPNTDSSSSEGADSYASMSQLLRGSYLLWIAGGRNMIPPHSAIPATWFMGIERRVIVDRQDISVCILEVFRVLALIRNAPLYDLMEHFAVWASMNILMPEEQILRIIPTLLKVPSELFCFMLVNYSNSKLPLPSYLAFMLMNFSPLSDVKVPYSDVTLSEFSSIYKNKTNGGFIPITPRAKIPIAYVVANESIPKDKRKQEIIDIPDFFSDKTQFSSLIECWKEFSSKYEKGEFEQVSEVGERLEDRADWGDFIRDKLNGAEPPLVVPLSDIAEIMGIEQAEKPTSIERKDISEMARVEGFLVIPDLCVSGKSYSWNDPIGLSPVAMGEKISENYNAAALAFEFSSGILGDNSEEALLALLNKVISRFSLVRDELTRLNVLVKILKDFTPDPQNIGECIQVWFQEEDRGFIRDFFLGLLNPSYLEQLNTLLEIYSDPKDEELPVLMGEKFTELVGTLFRNR